ARRRPPCSSPWGRASVLPRGGPACHCASGARDTGGGRPAPATEEGPAMSAQLWQAVTWDVARAGGLIAYLLLTLAVALGLALSLRWQRPRWPRLITNELHGFVTLLSLVFIGVHVLAVWVDPFMRFGWRDIVVPLATSYRPLW